MSSHLRSVNVLQFCTSAFLALIASAPWSNGARAQTVQFDGNTPIALTTSTTLSAVSIDAQTGNVIVRSLAQNTQCTQAAGPAITAFGSAPSPVEPGANVVLNWQSSNTTSCSASQGVGTIWSSLGTLSTNGNQSILIPANTPNNTQITFQLNCTGANSQTVSQTTTVSVQVTNPGSCTAIYPNGVNSTWGVTFLPWPGYAARNRISSIPANGYESWSFVATSVAGQFGTVATYGYPGDGDGFGQLSISRTPGCFTAAALGTNCLGPVNRSAAVSWKNGGGPGVCALTPGLTYYVNLTYGNSISGPGPYCPGGSGTCGADVQNQQQD